MQHLIKPDYQNPNRLAIILPQKNKIKVEKKLSRFFGKNYIDNKKKFVTFYIRYKGKESNEYTDYLRASSPFRYYLKIFSYLIDKGYFIFIYGEYDTSILKETSMFRKIACFESIGVSRDEFCIYSALNCEYFIASPGGGTYFPFSRESYPKTLILNAMPFSFDIPYATIVYKNAIKKNGNFIGVEDLMNQYKDSYVINGCDIIENSEEVIYDATLEFLYFCNQNSNIHKDETQYFVKKTIFPKNKIRISPVWIKYTEENL